jgi:hypothetical protein
MAISNQAQGLKPGVCTSTTRPSTPYTGMMIYETDTNMVAVWNGSSWRYISATTPTNGTVLQIAYGSTATESRISSTSSWTSTGITATITPRSSSSKILVQVSMQYRPENGNEAAVGILLTRNGTTVYSDGNNYAMGYSSNASGSSTRGFFQYLDSPSSTSSTAYLLYARAWNAAVNVSFQDDSLYTSTMTLMEIAG